MTCLIHLSIKLNVRSFFVVFAVLFGCALPAMVGCGRSESALAEASATQTRTENADAGDSAAAACPFAAGRKRAKNAGEAAKGDSSHECSHGCAETAERAEPTGPRKVGVLLVSHGSHSAGWRRSLLAVEEAVRDEILREGTVAGVRSAFMEYTEPSIATQLKAFDRESCTDVVLVPLLLTVSAHSFDDIPTIVGLKRDALTTRQLPLEGIDIYRPAARVRIAPLLDFPDVLGRNVVRRVSHLSGNPADEGVVLVAYGDKDYEEEWKQLLDSISGRLSDELGIDCVRHAWCGHLVSYKQEPTVDAIRDVLRSRRRAIVIPLLVGVDEMFQGKIIGGAVKSVGENDRVAYRPDAVLPDENVNQWVVQISLELASKCAVRHAISAAE